MEIVPSQDTLPIAPAIYQLWQGQLRENVGANFYLHQLPFEPQALSVSNNQIYLGGREGLWVFDQGVARKYYNPGTEFPKDLTSIKCYGHLLGMLTRDRDLYVYDTIQQSLTFIAKLVEDFSIDKWQTVHYAKGSTLFAHQGYVNTAVPDLEITGLYLDGEAIDPPYRYDSKSVFPELRFTTQYAPTFNKLNKFYRIDSGEWTSFDGKDKLTLPFLSPGRHTVQLRAEASEQVFRTSEEITVTIPEESAAKYWPWIFGLLGSLLLLNLVSQARLKSDLKEIEAEREKIKLELKLSQEQQKLGLLQMNPHFLFNTLNSIGGLIALNENKKARQHLNKFSKMMRQVLDASMEESVTLEQELNFIESYLSLEQMIRNDKFDYKITNEVAPSVSVPPMILQPFIENAIIHGLKHKEGRGYLGVTLKEADKAVQVTIEDDGIGRIAAAKYRSEGHKSAAINIIKQRLKSLNAWGNTDVIYEDLSDAEGNPRGTLVSLHLPKL